jgi:hypothetical protein
VPLPGTGSNGTHVCGQKMKQGDGVACPACCFFCGSWLVLWGGCVSDDQSGRPQMRPGQGWFSPCKECRVSGVGRPWSVARMEEPSTTTHSQEWEGVAAPRRCGFVMVGMRGCHHPSLRVSSGQSRPEARRCGVGVRIR